MTERERLVLLQLGPAVIAGNGFAAEAPTQNPVWLQLGPAVIAGNGGSLALE